MTKLTIICGPTAVGKTNFALKMAQEYGADLISVDSRQVYLGMDIGTGKDIPHNASFTCKTTFSVGKDTYRVGYYTIQSTRLWLCDIATPNQPFSSAIFKRAFDITIDLIGRDLPIILIGGTGYYLKSIINPPATMAIPPNQKLRRRLEKQTVTQLQQCLRKLDNTRLSSMNNSDYSNPRRLIRAIEVSESRQKNTVNPTQFKVIWLGLTAPKAHLADRIASRVVQRVSDGFADEFISLSNEYPNFLNLPTGKTLGYQEWEKYIAGEWNQEKAIAKWTVAEIAYAKRQLTWFNKQSDLIWFDITDKNWYAQASALLERWINHGINHA